MSLLFLEKKPKKYYALWLVLLLSTCVIAQDSIPDFNFEEHCKSSDAYLLYSYNDIFYVKSWAGYKKLTFVRNKLVVNNNSGVNKYAFLALTEFVANNLKEIDVKTLKSDGTVIELDSSLVFKKKANNKKFEAINYPIPGVEPGDTINTFYAYTEYLNKNELLDFVNLYADVPSFNTEYSIRSNPKELLGRYKTYNNLKEPQVILNDSLMYCLFKMEKVKGLSENQNTCLPCELPYLYYSMESKDSELRKWKDVYNQEFNVITQPISFDYEKSSYYRRWKKKVIGEAKDSSKYYKFKLLHKDIIDNVTMKPVDKRELLKSSGYFLKEKSFDPLSIRRLFRQLLEDLQIEYWAVFARSKRTGPIDPYYIRKGEYDHVFFAYENDKGNLKLLYPHEAHYKYEIEEIPTSLYNTEAVIAKPYLTEKLKKKDKFISTDFKLAEVDSVTTKLMKLPVMRVNHNYIKQLFYSKVDVLEKDLKFRGKFVISGGLSTDLRNFFQELNQNEEMSNFYDALADFEGSNNAFQVDSITSTNFKHTKPFVFTSSSKGTLKGGVSFINDSIVNVSLEKLIQHSQLESEQNSTDLNYYLDYSYADYCTIMLDFPGQINVLGLENLNEDFKNDYGEYLFKIKVNDNRLTLESSYKIINDIIPKQGHNQLQEMNKLVREIKNKRLIIKIK